MNCVIIQVDEGLSYLWIASVRCSLFIKSERKKYVG